MILNIPPTLTLGVLGEAGSESLILEKKHNSALHAPGPGSRVLGHRQERGVHGTQLPRLHFKGRCLSPA